MQFGNKYALDISLEGAAINRTVEYEGRDHTARGQASDESRCFPVAVESADTQAFAAAAATMGPSHLGRGPGLIDEDQTFGIEIKLAFEPGLRFAPLARKRSLPAHARGAAPTPVASLPMA